MENSTLILLIVLYLGLMVLMIASGWVIFEKAGKPGWASIVPIYNIVVMLEIVQKPMIWLLYLLIPCVNIYFAIVLTIEFAKAYGKSAGYAVGLILLPMIFYPMLAFGDAQYQYSGRRKKRREEEEEEEEERPRRRRDEDDDDRIKRRR